MKTKIRTLITVCVFATIGVLNVNAATNSDEKNVSLANGSESISALNEKIASFTTEANELVDYQKEAQMVTKWIADRIEAEATQQVLERNNSTVAETNSTMANFAGNENDENVTDFSKEAQLMVKLTADNEEAKAIRKLVSEGKITENR